MGAVRFYYGGGSEFGVGFRENQCVLPWAEQSDGRLRVPMGGGERGGRAGGRGVEAVRVRVGLLLRTLQIVQGRGLHPQTPKKRLRSSQSQRQKPLHPHADGDRLRPPQAGRPGHRRPHRPQPVQQPLGKPPLGESKRADQALVRHEREPRLERPEAVEAGGGAQARGGGMGAVRFYYGGGSEFGVGFRENQCVLPWAEQSDGRLRVPMGGGERGGRAGRRGVEGRDYLLLKILAFLGESHL